jgi:hypothetical protein
MEITWSIAQLSRDLSDGLVTAAHWRCTVVDEDQSVSTTGSVGFKRGGTFIEYENLTEEEVLNWVKINLNVFEIETGLQSHIDGLKSPISAAGVPW